MNQIELNKIRTANLLHEANMRAYSGKHTGSISHKKLKQTIKRKIEEQKRYEIVLEAMRKGLEEAQKIQDAEIISEEDYVKDLEQANIITPTNEIH